MAYPTPTIYTYRVAKVNPVRRANGDNAYYVAQFSQDSGTTYGPIHGIPYGSLQEAFQAIGFIVSNESQFRNSILYPNKFNRVPVIPTVTYLSYPPA